MSRAYGPVNGVPRLYKDLVVTAAKPKIRVSGHYVQYGNGARSFNFGVDDSNGTNIITDTGSTPANGNGSNPFTLTRPRNDAGLFTIGETVRVYFKPNPWEAPDWQWNVIDILLELVD